MRHFEKNYQDVFANEKDNWVLGQKNLSESYDMSLPEELLDVSEHSMATNDLGAGKPVKKHYPLDKMGDFVNGDGLKERFQPDCSKTL